MARGLEALQSLHLPRYCAPLAYGALFLGCLMAGEGCISFILTKLSPLKTLGEAQRQERQGVLSSNIFAVCVKFFIIMTGSFCAVLVQIQPLEEMTTLPKMVLPYVYHNAIQHVVCLSSLVFQYVKLDGMRVYLKREFFN